jgi:PKHD-type hydroxylase
MLTKYSYYWFNKALTDDQCDRIIENGENRIKNLKKEGISTEATTFGETHKGAKNAGKISIEDKTESEIGNKKVYIRDSEVSWFGGDQDQWIYSLLTPYIAEANQKAGWKYDYDYHECIQFTKYGLNQFYGWHIDGEGDHFNVYRKPNPNSKRTLKQVDDERMWGRVRKISMTVNLSPENSYEGGNLKFDYGPHFKGKRFQECTEMRPRGSIIIFPSFLHHQVTPVTSGTRYSLVMWTIGKPFK